MLIIVLWGVKHLKELSAFLQKSEFYAQKKCRKEVKKKTHFLLMYYKKTSYARQLKSQREREVGY